MTCARVNFTVTFIFLLRATIKKVILLLFMNNNNNNNNNNNLISTRVLRGAVRSLNVPRRHHHNIKARVFVVPTVPNPVIVSSRSDAVC